LKEANCTKSREGKTEKVDSLGMLVFMVFFAIAEFVNSTGYQSSVRLTNVAPTHRATTDWVTFWSTRLHESASKG